jgi:hypothetical protein
MVTITVHGMMAQSTDGHYQLKLEAFVHLLLFPQFMNHEFYQQQKLIGRLAENGCCAHVNLCEINGKASINLIAVG